MAKGERRKKREEIRRIVAEDEKRRKEKAIKKDKPRPATYRKDRDGNIILWGNIKFSKMSFGVLGAMGAIAVFFYIVSLGVGEMEGYIEPEFSFEACQEDGFTNDMCKFHYKFCREYADGGKLCTFAEENPYVDYDRDENRWTEEEQDFLPPTEYLPFVQYAEARGEDEPVCYSSACKVDNPDLVAGKIDDGGAKDVATAKLDLKKIEDKIIELTKKVDKWELEKASWNNVLWERESDLEEAEDEYKDAKKEYRHATDVRVQNQDDVEMQKEAKRVFEDATKKLKIAQKEYAIEQNRYDKRMTDLREAKNEIIKLQDSLGDALRGVTDARLEANKQSQGDNKFINIKLSNTCLSMIENGLPTKCPTYRDLMIYDNTVKHVSGEFTDMGYDVKREKPMYKNYWKYYQQQPEWKIITVDPDPAIIDRGVTITIEASEFTYLENIKSVDKTPSYNATGLERYEWHNVKYYDNCKNVMIAPDMDLLPDVINNIWNDCEKQEPNIIELIFDDFETKDSQWYAYATWLKDAMERCLTKC